MKIGYSEMNLWNLASLIGTILTIISTVVAIVQAKKAKKYKEEIRSDRLKMVLIDLLPYAKIAREECKKIIQPVRKPMRGVDPQKVLNSIQDFTDKVKEQSHKFNSVEYKSTLNSLDSNISKYKQITEDEERFRIGESIYEELNDMISMISRNIDKSI